MQLTIDETERRRAMQLKYNEEHHITPQAIIKARNSIIGQENISDKPSKAGKPKNKHEQGHGISYELQQQCENEFNHTAGIAADPIVKYMNTEEKEKAIERLRTLMIEAAKRMDFIEAAQYRDELLKMEESLVK